MFDGSATGDYFSQYGMMDYTPKVIKETPAVTVTASDTKVTISDSKGIPRNIPTLKYINDLETKIDRLEEVNRTMKTQISFLNGKLNQLANAITSLSKKSFNSYEY